MLRQALLAVCLVAAITPGPALAVEADADAPATSALSAADDTGALVGTVVDADERPVPEARVTVLPATDGCPREPDDCPEPITADADEDGRWRVDELEAGSYHLHLADPSGRHAHAWWEDSGEPEDTVEVTEGSQTEVDAVLQPAAELAVEVTDHRDAPLPEATVTVTPTFFWTIEEDTDADGRARIGGLRPGEVTATVSSGRAGLEDRTITGSVSAGENRAEVTLALVPVTVERVAGRTRVETAVAASRHAFEQADTVVLAAADSFPDALAAAPLAAALEGPLLLAGPRLSPAVLEELDRLDATDVVVVGAVGAVPLVVQAELDRAGLAVRRLAGETRFDTAALIARELGSPEGEVIIASGVTFADALSVAPLAAARGIPILLAGPGPLPADTARAVADLGAQRAIVVGGPAAVSDEAVSQLPDPVRVAGSERYATSVAVAELAVDRGLSLATVHLATGREFPDALAAGPVAGHAGGPLLLLDGIGPRVSDAVFAFLHERAADSGTLVAFGGSAAIAPEVLDEAAAAASGVGR